MHLLFVIAYLLQAQSVNISTNLTTTIISTNLTTTINSTAYNYTLNATVNQTIANITQNFTGSFEAIKGNVTVHTGETIAGALKATPGIIDTIFSGSSQILASIIAHGYTSLFLFMTLDSSSLPPPSEFIIPPAGFLVKRSNLDFGLVFITLMLANALGITVDYFAAELLGREFIYKHSKFLHINARSLQQFESWFATHGEFAVFGLRMVPVLRTWVSFPAGFTKMPKGEFYLYSLTGAAVYNYLLLLFGYYLISSQETVAVVASVGLLVVILYLVYRYSRKRIGIRG